MNKVMNINIGGSVFYVNEDAYDKLKSYLRQKRMLRRSISEIRILDRLNVKDYSEILITGL